MPSPDHHCQRMTSITMAGPVGVTDWYCGYLATSALIERS